MKQYLTLMKKIIDEGTWKQNRTGIRTKYISGFMFEHDMQDGFPAITTKQLFFRTMAVELEGFLKGITSKTWFQSRGCRIWDHWCNKNGQEYKDQINIIKSENFQLGNTDMPDSEVEKIAAFNCDDLGPIYGYQWRRQKIYREVKNEIHCAEVDQLQTMINKLKSDPLDRRNIVNAWNIADMPEMALPPCHYGFQVLSDGTFLDLLWNQRSCDVPLGIPFNIASYGLLLTLISRETGLVPRKLVGFLADCHIYENQMETAKKQIERDPHVLPKLRFHHQYGSIFDWSYEDVALIDYKNWGKLEYPIAV